MLNQFPNIAAYQQQVETALSQFAWPEKPASLYEPIAYFLKIGGKRLRPAMLMAATELFGSNPQLALNAALGIELFHNFTLMHDDIMDQAPLRRGMQTVHTLYNTNKAILAGDALFVKSCMLVAQVPTNTMPAVLQTFWQAALEVCEGQQLDMDFETMNNVTLPEYIHMIGQKTAVLLAASLKIGALIGGAITTDAENMYQFGLNIGIAFQLQDDILDVFGTPEKFGKRPGGDIVSNKKTCLQIMALQNAESTQLNQLKDWFNPDANHQPTTKIEAVTAIYEQLGIKEAAQKCMQSYWEQSLTALDKVNATQDEKNELRNFASFLINRDY